MMHVHPSTLLVDPSLAPPLALPKEISLDDATKAILLASQGANIAFLVRDIVHARRVASDFHGLLMTGTFGRCKVSLGGLFVTFSIGGGRIVFYSPIMLRRGAGRGMTFARVWDVS